MRVWGTVGDFQTCEPGNVGAITNESGRFRVVLAPGSHQVDIRRLGYEPRTFVITLRPDVLEAELRMALSQVPVELPEVVVRGEGTKLVFGDRRAFYRRQPLGFGHFLTRAEIEFAKPQVVSTCCAPFLVWRFTSRVSRTPGYV